MSNANESFWSPQQLQVATHGVWLRPPQQQTLLPGLSIDSRAIAPGQAFVALPGERFDGHGFLGQVISGGAKLLIVSRPEAAKALQDKTIAVLHVPDTHRALLDLACAYRQVLAQAGTKVIAVTGSNGKTTTRRLIHAVLSTRYTGTQSPRSFNNHIGVPLTLLAAKQDDDFVVVEVGTNAPGEIAALGAIAQPDAAVITTIGEAHLAGLGGLNDIVAEKASLLEHLKPQGLAVVYGDEPLLVTHLKQRPTGAAVVRFGRDHDNHLQLCGCDSDADGLSFEIVIKQGWSQPVMRASRNAESMRKREETAPLSASGGRLVADDYGYTPSSASRFRLPLLGSHNACNALAAVAVGRWMGLDDRQIQEGLLRAEVAPMRLSVSRLGNASRPLTVINDAYNANPQSVAASIHTLATFEPNPPSRRVLILGDMLELGDAGAKLHEEVGRQLAALPSLMEQVALIGPLMSHAAKALRDGGWPSHRLQYFESWDDSMADEITATLRAGDVVMLKASRGMRLERLLPRFERAASDWSLPLAKTPDQQTQSTSVTVDQA